MQNNRNRERVERGIWRRTGADGKVRHEITYRDSAGKQRRQVVEGGWSSPGSPDRVGLSGVILFYLVYVREP